MVFSTRLQLGGVSPNQPKGVDLAEFTPNDLQCICFSSMESESFLVGCYFKR